MQSLIWIGTAVTLLGLVGLIWCITRVAKARKEVETDDELKERIAGVVPINLGALCLSAIGLMLVIAGILLS